MDFCVKLLSMSLIFLVVAVTFASTHLVPSVFAAGNDDSDNKEVGVWWVSNYHGQACNLDWTDDDAEGFYNLLGSKGFTRRFDRGDDNAWESHFERGSVGGQDSNFADDVDFVYFAGHGDASAFYFGTNHDGDGSYTFRVHYTEVDWGDRDLEWIFISACRVLEQTPTEWDPAFHNPKTLHGMAGFHTEMMDTDDLGTYFARYLTDTWGPYSIRDAWARATQDDPHQTSSQIAAIYAVCVHYYPWTYTHYWNENLPGYGGGMYSDPPTQTSRYVRAIYLEYANWAC